MGRQSVGGIAGARRQAHRAAGFGHAVGRNPLPWWIWGAFEERLGAQPGLDGQLNGSSEAVWNQGEVSWSKWNWSDHVWTEVIKEVLDSKKQIILMIAPWPVQMFNDFHKVAINVTKASEIIQHHSSNISVTSVIDPPSLQLSFRMRSTPSLVRVVQVMVVVPLMLEISWSRRCRVASCRLGWLDRWIRMLCNDFISFHVGSM